MNKCKDNSNPFELFIQCLIDNDINRKYLLRFCGQKTIVPFEQVFDESLYKNIVRFDYGSYAELFSANHKTTDELVVLKVIRAVSTDLQSRVKGVEFRSVALFEDIYSEFQITAALSSLRSSQEFQTNCFPRVLSTHLLCGDIPHYFLDEKLFDGYKPIRDDIFKDFVFVPREYAVIVMSFGGQPLWKAIKNKDITAKQVLSVLKQVMMGLAIAEGAFEFEHRDLHESNILIHQTSQQNIQFIHRFKSYTVESCGLEANIIDTTFSRIKIDDTVFYKDLKSIMTFDDNPSAMERVYQSVVNLTKNNWKQYTPKSNIIWFKYICKRVSKSPAFIETSDGEDNQKIKHIIDILSDKTSLQDIDFNSI